MKAKGLCPLDPRWGLRPQTPNRGWYNKRGSGASGPSGVQGQSPWPFS